MTRRRVRRILTGVGCVLLLLCATVWWFLGVRWAPLPDPDGTLITESLSWESRPRTFQVYRPARPMTSPPIVFVLHGSAGDAAAARMLTAGEFERLADQEGFLVVYPEGFESHWNGCRAAGPYAANQLDVDDVGFFRAIVARLVREDNADPAAVFATGISNGGHMAIRLALEAPDLVQAVAPIVASLPTDDNFDCEDKGVGIAFLLINGTEDPMNPYGGGDVALYGIAGNRGGVHSTPATIEIFAARAGYEGAPVVSKLPDVDPGDGSTIVQHRWAQPGRPEVTLLAVDGGGHSMPHPVQRLPRLIGPTNADINAPEVIWEFFARNRR